MKKLKDFDGERLLNVVVILLITAYLIGMINWLCNFR